MKKMIISAFVLALTLTGFSAFADYFAPMNDSMRATHESASGNGGRGRAMIIPRD